MDLETYFTAEAELVCQMVSPNRRASLREVSPGPMGEAVCVWTFGPPVGGYRTAPNGVTVPQAEFDRPSRTVVTLHREAEPYAEYWIDESLAWAEFQPLPGDLLLAVGARAARTPTGGQHNGNIIDRDGTVLAEGFLGDDVESVRATRDGDIWIAYGDEGMGGNLGWGFQFPDGGFVESPSMDGLVRWSRDFTIQWRPESPVWEPAPLTLFGNEVIGANYRGKAFSSVIGEFETGIEGIITIASDGSRLAVVGAGGYGQSTVTLGRLEGGRLVPEADGSLPRVLMGTHEALTIAGWGDVLNIWAGTKWYRVSVGDMFAGIRPRR